MDMFVDSRMVMSSVSLICEWLLFSGLSLNWQLSILKENDVGSLAIFGFYSIILEKPNFKFSKWVQPKPAKSSQVKSSQDKERKGKESKQTVSISQVPNFSKLADVSIFDRKEMVELINMKRILHLGAALSCMFFSHRLTFRVVTVVTVVSQSFNYKPQGQAHYWHEFQFWFVKAKWILCCVHLIYLIHAATATCPCWSTTMGMKMVKVHRCLFGSGWEVKLQQLPWPSWSWLVKSWSACVRTCHFVMSCVRPGRSLGSIS